MGYPAHGNSHYRTCGCCTNLLPLLQCILGKYDGVMVMSSKFHHNIFITIVENYFSFSSIYLNFVIYRRRSTKLLTFIFDISSTSHQNYFCQVKMLFDALYARKRIFSYFFEVSHILVLGSLTWLVEKLSEKSFYETSYISAPKPIQIFTYDN